jgi:hypothetical protein
MTKPLILITIFLIINFNLYSQIIVVDSQTKQPIPNVSVFNSEKNFINLTNKNGQIFINNDTISIKDLSFSHISYDDKIIEKKIIKNFDTIFLSPRIQKLEDVILTTSLNKDYIKIKGFYRSYLYNNNIVFAYSDGLVEYYINTKNDKVKNNILSSRLLQRKYENNIRDKGGIKVGNSINPGIPHLTIINSNIKKFKLFNIKNTNDNNFIIIDTISRDFNNERVRVSVDNIKFNDIKNIFKIIGIKIEIISNQYTSEFSNQIDNILNLKNFVANNIKAISFKNDSYKKVSYEENVQEFYVIESRYISKNTYDKINTKSDLNCIPTFNENEIISTSNIYNFPLMPNFIKNQISTGSLLNTNK